MSGVRRLLSAPLSHPRRAGLAALLLFAPAVWGASTLRARSSESLLAKRGSAVAKATRAQERTFGGEPIVVSLQGNLATTLDPANLNVLVALERRISSLAGVQTVFGPGTFIQQTADQIDGVIRQDLVALHTRGAAAARQDLSDMIIRYGYIGVPSVDNEDFVGQLIFGSGTQPKQRFAWLFPDDYHALVIVRPRAGLSDARTLALGKQIEQLVGAAPLEGVQTLVAGVPLVTAGLASEFAGELLRLAPIVIAAMVIVLLIGLGRRLGSLLVLVPAGGAVLLTAALSSALGLGLTPATLAALPVILGLAIDYAIQLQARYWRWRESGATPPQAATGAVSELGGTLVLAGCAMATGFLALLLSDAPLVNRLGVTLALGVGSSLVSVLCFAPVLLARADRLSGPPPKPPLPRIVLPPRARSLGLAAVVAAAFGGLALSSGAAVDANVKTLAPSNMPQLKAVEQLERELGTSGQLWIEVHARNVTSPQLVQWMSSVQERVLALDHRLRPGPNLAALLETGAGDTVPSQAEVRSLLKLVPAYFTAPVLNADRTRAELSFGVPLMSGSAQARLVERIKRVLSSAPAGVSASPAGVIALSVASLDGLRAGRPWLLLAAASIIFGLLLAVRRRLDRAIVPLVPALLVAGLCALLVAATGVQLSPLSAGLDPLVLAVGVEFGVLLEARYHEARTAGRSESEAARLATQQVGAPVAVAAATVALSFATLITSRLGVLAQFGALASVEVILCAVLAIAIVPALAAGLDGARAVRATRRVWSGSRIVVRPLWALSSRAGA
jgi:predicted RND superfamily exporter protein